MPYQHLDLSNVAGGRERGVLMRADWFLADVYVMCCTRLLRRARSGECNFSAILVLLCVIDAVASHVYPVTRNRKKQDDRFETLVNDRLPWDASWMPKEEAARILYIECRNPLTHQAGFDTASKYRKPGFGEPVVTVWGKVRPRQMRYVDVRKSWPAKWPILEPDPVQISSEMGGPTRETVNVVPLYWAVKQLVRSFT